MTSRPKIVRAVCSEASQTVAAQIKEAGSGVATLEQGQRLFDAARLRDMLCWSGDWIAEAYHSSIWARFPVLHSSPSDSESH